MCALMLLCDGYLEAPLTKQPFSDSPSPHYSHTPRWISILFPEGETSAPLSQAEFVSLLGDASFDMPMGPRGIIKAGEETLELESLNSCPCLNNSD